MATFSLSSYVYQHDQNCARPPAMEGGRVSVYDHPPRAKLGEDGEDEEGTSERKVGCSPFWSILSPAIQHPLIDHGQVVVQGDVVGDAVAGSQAVAAAGEAFVEGIPHAAADRLFVATAEEIDVEAADHGNAATVGVLGLPDILDRVFEICVWRRSSRRRSGHP